MRKKDIVFLCQYFYPEYVSSATLPYDVAEELSKRGKTVGALVGYPKEYCNQSSVPKRETHKGIDIKRVKYLQINRKGFLGRLANFLSFFLMALINIRFLEEYRVVIVYSNPPMLPLLGVIAKKLYRLKLVFVSFDVYPEIAIKSGSIDTNSLMARAFRQINTVLFENVDSIIAVSSDMKEYLINNRNIEKEKVFCVPNWCEDGCIQSQNGGDDSFTVAYLGNLGTCQEEETIIDAIKRLENDKSIRFLFAGHGNKMNRLRKLKEDNQWNNIVIHGFLTGSEFDRVLEQSDCFVVSLIEGLYGLCAPSKVCTYFMRGKPIVCIMDERTEIAVDISSNNAGKVIRAHDSQSFVDFIKFLSKNKAAYDEISGNSRSVFQNKYEKKKCVDRFCCVIEESEKGTG